MATLSRIAVHPIKSLDPVNLDRVSFTEVGGLEGDRVYIMLDEDGAFVNGKRTPAVFPLRAAVDLDERHVALDVRGEDAAETFHLDHDREALTSWLTDYFGLPVELEERPGGAGTDSAVYGDGRNTGPTIISRATLREAATWYDGIDPDELRLRLRPNLVVEGVPAFWEDVLVADGGCRFHVGDVTLEASKPVPRCVVPTRDPRTGEAYEGFQETFLGRREARLPPWADRSAFDGNLYRLMVVTRVPEEERGGELRVGDEVRLPQTVADLVAAPERL